MQIAGDFKLSVLNKIRNTQNIQFLLIKKLNMKQLYLIDEFKKKSIEDCTISAVLMYGSFIKGEGDKFSDIEFYIFLRDDCHIDKYKWISSVNPIDLIFVNEFGTDVVIFDNLIRGEFHFLPLKEISIIKSWQGHTSFEFKEKMNLVDKDGLLTDVLNDIEPPYEPIRNTPAQIEWLADSLINNLLFASNLFQRGEYAHLHSIFQYIQKYALWLIRIYEQSEKHWESPTKKLEVDISSYWYNKYQTIVPIITRKSLNKALLNAFVLSKDIFKKTNVSSSKLELIYRIENTFEINHRNEET